MSNLDSPIDIERAVGRIYRQAGLAKRLLTPPSGTELISAFLPGWRIVEMDPTEGFSFAVSSEESQTIFLAPSLPLDARNLSLFVEAAYQHILRQIDWETYDGLSVDERRESVRERLRLAKVLGAALAVPGVALTACEAYPDELGSDVAKLSRHFNVPEDTIRARLLVNIALKQAAADFVVRLAKRKPLHARKSRAA